MSTVTVLAATGKTGRRVVRALAHAGHTVRAASRSSACRFDWDDDSTWPDALAGADAVYLVADESEQQLERLERFVTLAGDYGVRRLVLLSARQWSEFPNPLWDRYLTRETMVRAGSVPWTILRPVWFLQNFTEEPYLADGLAAGAVTHGFGEGRHPFIDAEDIAAVAAVALTEDGHAGHIYELSGPEAVTAAEVVAALGAASGQRIAARGLSSEDYAEFSQQFFGEDAAELVALMDLIREGKDARLSDGVAQVLGRPPRSVAQFAATAAM